MNASLSPRFTGVRRAISRAATAGAWFGPSPGARAATPLAAIPSWCAATGPGSPATWRRPAASDPFGDYDLATLRHCFPDLVVHFKDHFVADLSRPPESFVSTHHRQHAAKAMRTLDVEICESPLRTHLRSGRVRSPGSRATDAGDTVFPAYRQGEFD